MAVGVEFYGWANDGEVRMLPDLHLTVFVAVPLAMHELIMNGDPCTPTMKVAAYELQRDPATGQPTMNDRGMYRYQYAGTRDY